MFTENQTEQVNLLSFIYIPKPKLSLKELDVLEH